MTKDAGEPDLEQVVDKLAERYPEWSRDSLRAEVEQARRSFSGARVHGFLPVLIERRVRARVDGAPAL